MSTFIAESPVVVSITFGVLGIDIGRALVLENFLKQLSGLFIDDLMQKVGVAELERRAGRHFPLNERFEFARQELFVDAKRLDDRIEAVHDRQIRQTEVSVLDVFDCEVIKATLTQQRQSVVTRRLTAVVDEEQSE